MVSGKPHARYLAEIHPRVHFCRDAALVRLTSGAERIISRRLDRHDNERFQLYLDDLLVADAFIPFGTTGARMSAGYGDGLYSDAECQAARDRINAGFSTMENAVSAIEPLLGLLASGLYVVADFDLFPAVRSGRSWLHYFWDEKDYHAEAKFCHWHVGGFTEKHDSPHYFLPTQRASLMNPEQVQHYRSRLNDGDSFPRAVALYLNGCVSLLLDGHHKAAAAAAEGQPVRTLVIFPIRNPQPVLDAVQAEKRLYLRHQKHYGGGADGPLILCDGSETLLSETVCLETMVKRRMPEPPAKETPPWGCIPDEFRAGLAAASPDESLLEYGTRLAPDKIRSAIADIMQKPKPQRDTELFTALACYARLFPESKWLTPSQRAWLVDKDNVI